MYQILNHRENFCLFIHRFAASFNCLGIKLISSLYMWKLLIVLNGFLVIVFMEAIALSHSSYVCVLPNTVVLALLVYGNHRAN